MISRENIIACFKDFEKGNLHIDSYVNCDKIFTLDKNIILNSVGILKAEKTHKIVSKIIEIIRN